MYRPKLYIASKAGGCRSGGDSHGSVWHYVERDPAYAGAALCGAAPRIQWSAPWREDQTATCPKCLKVAARLLAPYQKLERDCYLD
jgi:hypothetical protein